METATEVLATTATSEGTPPPLEAHHRHHWPPVETVEKVETMEAVEVQRRPRHTTTETPPRP